MAKRAKAKAAKQVEAIRHTGDTRVNIPTAEHQSVIDAEQAAPRELRYPRNTDLDPQLVWRGKDYEDWSDLVVQAPPLYIQEKVHPKALVDDLLRESSAFAKATADKSAKDPQATQIDLFADFNGIGEGADRTDFYQHDQNWTNRMILGDSLQVMASLAEREGLRGKVQCIYLDPPYGIRFNSNFQWSTTSRDVKDGNAAHITREPEQVKAFRDTWRDGIHSYLTYLRDRLTVARDLLTESGSIFVQIGDENVHRVRALMDEVFGAENFVDQIIFQTSSGRVSDGLDGVYDAILWFAKNRSLAKFRALRKPRSPKQLDTAYSYLQFPDGHFRAISPDERSGTADLPTGSRRFRPGQTQSQSGGESSRFGIAFDGHSIQPPVVGGWRTSQIGFRRAAMAERLMARGKSIAYRLCDADNPMIQATNIWTDTVFVSFGTEKAYVVQTNPLVIERCLLMTTDPGDLVVDPTCGSGTTATAAEKWGRRWITIDTSRVALALARARIMGARYPYYLLADSQEGLRKEAEVSGRAFADRPTYGDVRHGFVYERVPHITLKSIANNAEIDVIYDEHQPAVQAALDTLNAALRGHKAPFKVTTGGREGKDVRFDAPKSATFTMPSGEIVPAAALVEWEVPREFPADWPPAALRPLNAFWEARIARQKAIDASIAAKAEFEYLYDRPYEDKKVVRVAGPFTVESLSPHRMLGVDENDELIDPLQVNEAGPPYGQSFEQIILENLRTAGVQQAHKGDRITFTSVTPWPGEMICAEGRYENTRAAIFIGPEFGTVSRPDLVQAAREAGDAGFDVLIACAFNYEALASEFSKLGRIPVLKARMNADLHMGGALKPTGTGNLFVVFGEPDIEILHVDDGQVRVQVKGVDVFDPSTGEVRSDSTDGIACWFIDTDYNEESFFVRHAYFLGQNDPYGALKTTLKAEIDPDTWATLNSDISRPFPMPKSGRIAVKVINHLGDEVMKVFRVE
jgi:adenine-specific DNA-methyltransferase